MILKSLPKAQTNLVKNSCNKRCANILKIFPNKSRICWFATPFLEPFALVFRLVGRLFIALVLGTSRGEGLGSILASPGQHWSNFLEFFKEFRRACYPTRQRFQSGVSILRKQIATIIHSEITEIPAFHVHSVSLCGTLGLFSCTGFVCYIACV